MLEQLGVQTEFRLPRRVVQVGHLVELGRREVEAGEIIAIDSTGLRSIQPLGRKPQRRCVFEYVYFSRPSFAMNRGFAIRRGKC